MEEVNVQINTSGSVSSVLINGRDISMEASEVVYRHKAGEAPTLTVKYYVDNVDVQAVGCAMRKKT
ncbi:MAG TPA: hypothetical protein H9671_02960 [Firmicutes bacterium]|nr:hypothetical protein [Bacillota bacterium]